MEIWICVITKWEELYIKEWLDWNKKIGITHIIIGDNNDLDYIPKLSDVIQDYINEGYVEIIDVHCKTSYQNEFNNLIYHKYLGKFDWLGFIDPDEFLYFPQTNNNAQEFFKQEIFDNFDAILFIWKNYGDCGKLYYEDKPVQKRFTYTSRSNNLEEYKECKYFIKSNNNVKKLISHNSPLNNELYDNNIKFRVCDVCGKDDFEICINKIWDNINFRKIKLNFKYYNTAYIKHFITKTVEEYIKFKILKGRIDRREVVDVMDSRYNKGLFYFHNDYTLEKEKIFDQYKDQVYNFRKTIIKDYNDKNFLD